jgi:protein TonB
MPPDDGFTDGAQAPNTPGLVNPVVISEVRPAYTSNAMRQKVQGLVWVQVVIDANGTVSKARALNSLHPELDEAALVSARRWRFTPATLDGSAVATWAVIALEFRLH